MTPEQRANYELIGPGIAIHWPEIDEDISVPRRDANAPLTGRRAGQTLLLSEAFASEPSRGVTAGISLGARSGGRASGDGGSP